MEKVKKRLDPRGWELAVWKKFFAIAGLWNFSFALPAFLMPALNFRLVYGFSTGDFYHLWLNTVFFVAVFIFGIAYLMIAYNPPKNTGLIILGIIGKTSVGAGFYYLYAIDRVTILPVLGGTGDLIFTLYFICYLVLGPKKNQTQ
ncbi:MAG: hypothetical protein ACOZBW_08400 [Thermodesulfobacteriota bacterium]